MASTFVKCNLISREVFVTELCPNREKGLLTESSSSRHVPTMSARFPDEEYKVHVTVATLNILTRISDSHTSVVTEGDVNHFFEASQSIRLLGA